MASGGFINANRKYNIDQAAAGVGREGEEEEGERRERKVTQRSKLCLGACTEAQGRGGTDEPPGGPHADHA